MQKKQVCWRCPQALREVFTEEFGNYFPNGDLWQAYSAAVLLFLELPQKAQLDAITRIRDYELKGGLADVLQKLRQSRKRAEGRRT